MPRFFTQEISENQGKISGADAVHISRVLRMKTGENITVSDLNGYDYNCVLTSITADEVFFDVLDKHLSVCEPTVSTTLFMAFPKGDKFELIVQKCVELGIDRIVPVITARCIARPDEKSIPKKIDRYNKIAYEAAKQCGRAKIPVVEKFVDYSTALELSKSADITLFFYEKGGNKLQELVSDEYKNIAFFVGSEGGFEEHEAKQAEENFAKIATLGTRILRCETAAIAATTSIMLLTGNI